MVRAAQQEAARSQKRSSKGRDPRVRRAYFPELGDDHYESLVTVPVFSRTGYVIGAITLHAEGPHEFASADLDFLEHPTSLIAGAVGNARLFEETRARVDLLSDLDTLEGYS